MRYHRNGCPKLHWLFGGDLETGPRISRISPLPKLRIFLYPHSGKASTENLLEDNGLALGAAVAHCAICPTSFVHLIRTRPTQSTECAIPARAQDNNHGFIFLRPHR